MNALTHASTIDIDENNSYNANYCYKTCTKSLIVYICQITILSVVICVSLYNLTNDHADKSLWSTLLSSSIGYLMPAPKMRKYKLLRNE